MHARPSPRRASLAATRDLARDAISCDNSGPSRPRAVEMPEAKPRNTPVYIVRTSDIHGRGVFASRTIPKGTCIVEYRGERISVREAERRPDSDPANPYHTFLFELNDGRVIDAAVRGSAARWINHSCDPNCEPFEDDDGRVFIEAVRTIRKGEELAYDYKLNLGGRITAAMHRAYECRCGTARCRGTMLERKRTRVTRAR